MQTVFQCTHHLHHQVRILYVILNFFLKVTILTGELFFLCVWVLFFFCPEIQVSFHLQCRYNFRNLRHIASFYNACEVKVDISMLYNCIIFC